MTYRCTLCGTVHTYDGVVEVAGFERKAVAGKVAIRFVFDGPITFDDCPNELTEITAFEENVNMNHTPEDFTD